MPHHKSTKKRLRTSEKQNLVNRAARSSLRTLTRQVQNAKTPEEGKAALDILIPRLDKALKSGLYHKNTIARKKSQAMRLINSLESTGA